MKKTFILICFLFLFCNLSAQNYFAIQEGDTLNYQFKFYHLSLPNYEIKTVNYFKGIVTSTMLDTLKFLKVLDASYYYNQQEQKLYTLNDSNQIIQAVDFNTPAGNIFWGTVNRSPIARYGVYMESDIFNGFRDTVQYNNNFHWSFDFEDGIGLIDYLYEWADYSEVEDRYYKLIEAKGHNFSFTFEKPTLTISAVPLYKVINEFPFDISFTKNHSYPGLIDSLCVFINVYRNDNLIISRTSTPTSANPNSFPISLTPGELQPGDIVKLSFLMSDTALFKNRITVPENGTYNLSVVAAPSKWFLQNPYPTNSTLSAFDFKSPGILWAAGEAGVVLRTTDAGSTWDDLSNNKGDDLRSISFPDMNNGYALGGFSSIFKSTNNGMEWTKHVTGSTQFSTKVSFPTIMDGVLIANQSQYLFKTNNGGLNWSYSLKEFSGMEDIAFKNSNEGIIVGFGQINDHPNGFVYKTIDRGSTWVQKFVFYHGLKSCCFVNDALAFASGDYLIRSTDGGNTWTKLGWYHPSTKITFSDIHNGYSLYNGKAERTTDGGYLWTEVNSGSNNYYTGVTMFDSSTVLLFGQNGLIQKTTDGGLNWITISRGYSTTLHGSSIIDGNNALAVGENGKILKTSNGGGIWTEVESPTDKTLRSIFFSTSATGTVVGDSGVILRTDNGGASWNHQSSGTTNNLNCVYFLNNNYGFAAGAGVILKTVNGGSTWTSKSFTNTFNGISFSDENTGTVVGNNGVILRTTNGGENWIEQQSGITNDLHAVDLKDDNTGTAVGNQGNILKTSNGGATWTLCQNVPDVSLKSVKYLDNTLIAVGGAGTVLRSYDGGSLWVSEKINTKKELLHFSSADTSNNLIVGQDGLIYSSKHVNITSVKEEIPGNLVKNFTLEQNYPNPFNPSTTIKYSLASAEKVKITVFDILGREVKVLVDEEKSPGSYIIKFSGSNLSSGVYFYQIKAGNFIETKKMLLLK